MKARKLLLTFLLILPGLRVPANILTPEEALRRLGHSEETRGISNRNLSLSYTAAGKTGATAYLFQTTNQGYLLVSADDTAYPLLGYAEESGFKNGEMPCGLKAWIDFYSRRIDAARICRLPNLNTRGEAPEREPLAPALTTRWGQGEPYNDLCPKLEDKRCVTGCVATAMAQVLNHYRYPEKIKEDYEYEFQYLVGNEFFTDTLRIGSMTPPFDWENMRDSYEDDYTETEAQAVANLMYACGVSVDMMYGTSASGAISGFVPYPLWKYFGFDPTVTFVQRDCWAQEGMNWDDFVYGQLEARGAVLYQGVTSANEGHAFVCDGYDGDGYFHFNWGWNGISDGWFRLDALNPAVQGTGGSSTSLSFDFNQSVIGFLSHDGAEEQFRPSLSGRDEPFNITNSSVALGGKFTVTGCIVNESQFDYDIDFGCMLTDSEYATEGPVIPVMSFSLQSCYDKSIFKKATLPEDLAEGYYCIRPVITWEGREGWWTLPWNVKKNHVWMQVTDGKALFNVEPPTAGVEEIASEHDCTPYYVTLQGLRIDKPQKGQTYIKICGSKAQKVIL